MILNKDKDLVVVIDMINGFCYEGVFASENVAKLVPKMKEFLEKQISNQIEIIHYIDNHPEDAQEFASYPAHCIKGSSETQVIPDLDFKEIEHIYKNSTNGFMAKNPFVYHKNLYIIGVVSDICIFEFALSAQKYKEEFNLPYKVNVIRDLVTTFDGENHNADEVNDLFLNLLQSRGVTIL